MEGSQIHLNLNLLKNYVLYQIKHMY